MFTSFFFCSLFSFLFSPCFVLVCSFFFVCSFVFVVFFFVFVVFKGLVLVREAKVGDASGAARSELEAADEGEWDREKEKREKESGE